MARTRSAYLCGILGLVPAGDVEGETQAPGKWFNATRGAGEIRSRTDARCAPADHGPPAARAQAVYRTGERSSAPAHAPEARFA